MLLCTMIYSPVIPNMMLSEERLLIPEECLFLLMLRCLIEKKGAILSQLKGLHCAISDTSNKMQMHVYYTISGNGSPTLGEICRLTT